MGLYEYEKGGMKEHCVEDCFGSGGYLDLALSGCIANVITKTTNFYCACSGLGG